MGGLKVLFLAAEADPFVKVGGLGEVAGALPRAMRTITNPGSAASPRVDIRLVIPLHSAIDHKSFTFTHVASLEVPSRNGPVQGEILATEYEGLPVYLIAGTPFQPDTPVYSSSAAVDGKKYIFFSLAVLQLGQAINWYPDVVQANDWHTAAILYAMLIRDRGIEKIVRLQAIHNLPFLGNGTEPALNAFNLPPATDSDLPAWAQQLPLPLGLLAADHIVTVSPTYAQEILTPEFGSGLEAFLQKRSSKISGILNGIDIQTWDPASDPEIQHNYTADQLEARQANKISLAREFGLNPDPHVPLLAMVSRLDPQKGIDLVPPALHQLRSLSWQAIFLGSGSPELESALQTLEQSFPGRVRLVIGYDAALSHRIYASADALLIPSRYEPCGLTQMIAMRYGCVPVGRATGGLRDTIIDYDQDPDSTGFLFTTPKAEDLAGALKRMFSLFTNQGAWRELQARDMGRDFSWNRSARQYLDLYQTLVERKWRHAN